MAREYKHCVLNHDLPSHAQWLGARASACQHQHADGRLPSPMPFTIPPHLGAMPPPHTFRGSHARQG